MRYINQHYAAHAAHAHPLVFQVLDGILGGAISVNHHGVHMFPHGLHEKTGIDARGHLDMNSLK